MKRAVIAIIFLFLTTILAAHNGIMWGERNIKCISTEHFDIIYEPDSADSAALLYENAERILTEIQNFFGEGEIRMRVPVVISANCQRFNAICGSIPYPLINLYDTAIDESMAVFSDDLLSTFKHELTHAYTLNLKNERLNKITKALGNIYNIGLLNVTSGIAESATLTSESSFGEGRLNDEWTRQVTRQAKIENKWPKFWDEQGLSTKYYIGDYYYFNGEFAKYLQNTYGVEKYSAFWYACINIKTKTGERILSLSDAFYSVYRITLKSAWKNFEESLFVPEYSEPFDVDGITDFFTNSDENYSVENNRGAIYQNLSATENGLYYIDHKCANVYFVSNEKLNCKDNKKIAPKKIFHKSGITNISPSLDGRFIAYDYYKSNSANYKYCVGIYDTKTKHHIKVGDSLKTPSIVKQGNDYYLLALNFISQKKQITIQKIIIENDKIKKLGDKNFIPLANGTTVLSFTDIGNGKFAMILKGGMTWEICLGDLPNIANTNQHYDDFHFIKIKLPEEKMTLRYLSYSPTDNTIYFSWTKPDSMPRLGKFLLDENIFFLSDKNISGGIYYPVSLYDSKNNEDKIYYIGKFTKQNRIFYCKNQSLQFYQTENFCDENKFIQLKDLSEIPSDVTILQNPTEEILGNAKKYKPLKYYIQPLVIPISQNSSYTFDVRSANFGNKTLFPFLGVTLVSLNPWMQDQIRFSAGYGVETNSFIISTSFQSETDTKSFSYLFSTQAEFDSLGFKQSVTNADINLSFNWIAFSENAALLVGRSNTYYWFANKEKNIPNDNLFFLQNEFDVSVGKCISYESELFNTLGGILSIAFVNVFEKTLSGNPFKYNIMNLGTKLNFYVPRLLPIKCYDRFVYNLPSIISVNAYTTATDIFSGMIKTTLFGYDIQRGFPYLFFNKIYVTAGYNFSFKYKDYGIAGNFEIANIKNHFSALSNGLLPYDDEIFIDLNTSLSPNLGMINLLLDFSIGFGFKPNPLPDNKQFSLRINFDYTL